MLTINSPLRDMHSLSFEMTASNNIQAPLDTSRTPLIKGIDQAIYDQLELPSVSSSVKHIRGLVLNAAIID